MKKMMFLLVPVLFCILFVALFIVVDGKKDQGLDRSATVMAAGILAIFAVALLIGVVYVAGGGKASNPLILPAGNLLLSWSFIGLGSGLKPAIYVSIFLLLILALAIIREKEEFKPLLYPFIGVAIATSMMGLFIIL